MEKWKHDVIANKPPFLEMSKRQRLLLHGTLYHKLDVIRRIESGALSQLTAAEELKCSPSAMSKLLKTKHNLLRDPRNKEVESSNLTVFLNSHRFF